MQAIVSTPCLFGYAAYLTRRVRNAIYPRAPEVTPLVTGSGFDIVTIVFGLEVDLLALQARSFDQFLDPAFNGRIIIIINDPSYISLIEKIKANVLHLYGRWTDRVTIIPFHKLGHRLNPSNGWLIQQALKLAASRLIASPHYVVFDAKNHLVAPTAVDRFVDGQGRARLSFAYHQINMPRHDETCARYFASETGDGNRSRFAPMTPFVFHTGSVRDLVRHIETREQTCLETFFCKKRFLSEFMLYGSYLTARGDVELLYRDIPDGRITVWPCHDERALVAQAEASKAYCFGVHREHLAAIAPIQVQFLEAYWRRVGLLREHETFDSLGSPHRNMKGNDGVITQFRRAFARSRSGII